MYLLQSGIEYNIIIIINTLEYISDDPVKIKYISDHESNKIYFFIVVINTIKYIFYHGY